MIPHQSIEIHRFHPIKPLNKYINDKNVIIVRKYITRHVFEFKISRVLRKPDVDYTQTLRLFTLHNDITTNSHHILLT